MNPIKYSDLIQPDDSIDKLIEQLGDLITTYDTAKTKIQGAANDVAKSLQGVSGASDEQRKSIQLATVESDKLVAKYRDINSAQWKATQAFAEANAAKKESTRIDKLITQILTSQEGSYNKLSAQYRLNKIRLDAMSEAERKNTEAGRRLEAETEAIYEEMNRLQLATGKATLQVGHYERALGGLLGVNPKVVTALTDTKQAGAAVGGMMKALAGPVGIVLGLIAGLTAAFKLFKDSIHSTQTTGDEFDVAMGGWNATWEVFKKSVSAVDFSGFITGAREAMQAGRELKAVLDETFERTNSARILRASMSQENAILEETMRNQGKSLDERIAAADQYLENMQKIYDQETETARRTRDAQLEYLFSVTNRTKYATDEEREAAKQRLAELIKNYNLDEERISKAREYLKAEEKVESIKAQMRTTSNRTQQQALNTQLVTAEKAKNAFSQEVKDVAAFLKQYNLAADAEITAYVQAEENYLNAQAAAYTDQKRIVTARNNLEAQKTQQAEKEAKERTEAAEKEAKDKAAADEKAAKEAVTNQRNILNAQLQSIQLQIASTQDGTQEMLDLRLAMLEKQKEIEIFENNQKTEELRQDEQAINDKYDRLALLERAKYNKTLAERDLKAAQDLAEAELSLLDRNERQKTIFRLEQERDRLLSILRINETAVEKLTATEVEAIKKSIEAINKEIGRLPYNNLYELLGIGLDTQQQNALNTAVSSTVNSLRSIIDSWKEVADAAVSASEAQIDAAQKNLEAQMEMRAEGYANSVETAQKELDLAKKNQQKALAEQRKAQRAQIALDTAMQASSLITATANIWKALSGITGVGPALAIGAIATMWGSFAMSKVKAVEATKNELYGEGTVELLQGGSHASGHDIDLGTKPDGTRRRAEGGEYFAVINRKSSRRYRSVIPDVINSLNRGDFAQRYQRADERLADVALGFSGTNVSRLEKDVAAIRKQGEEERYTDGQGNTIIRYKNLTRKIYKN